MNLAMPSSPGDPATSAVARPWRAWRACIILAFLATLLLVVSDLLLDTFPTRVHVASNGTTMTVAAGGVTRTVRLERPVQALTFETTPGYAREYQIDGSDSTNNFTY